jgi:LPXTG-motif cell wall-anchored protein
VTTNSSGSFEREFDLDLARHPSLLADLYEQSRATLVLVAHTGAEAPAHCKRATSLPYTGAGTAPTGMVAGGLLAAGGLLLLATRRRRDLASARSDARWGPGRASRPGGSPSR